MTWSEILLTIIAVWILFRIFRHDRPREQDSFTFHANFRKPVDKRDGASKPVGKNKLGDTGGEYVDYEEIK